MSVNEAIKMTLKDSNQRFAVACFFLTSALFMLLNSGVVFTAAGIRTSSVTGTLLARLIFLLVMRLPLHCGEE